MTGLAIDDDLLCDEAIAHPDVYFRRLRETDPVHWNGRHRSWVITSYADVAAGLRDPRLSSNRILPHFDDDREPADGSWLDAVRRILAGWMVFKDPPEHTRLRRSVYRAFTPKSIELWEPRVASIIDDLLERMPRRGEVDFIHEFAFPLPAIVIADMLGVPASDRDYFKRLSDDLHPLVFGDLAIADRHERAGRALSGLGDYLRDLMAHFRQNPKDNILTRLAAQQSSGDLSEDEVVANSVLFLFGGHETTTNLLANGLRALLAHPEQYAAFRRRPQLAPQAVEEFLRYDGPAKLSVRWVTEDLKLAGRRIHKNERVLLIQAAANRDPNVFDRPDDMLLERPDNPHLAFGVGHHYCLGAPLARLEARLAFPRVLQRFPQLRLADDPIEWHRTILIRGMKSLPVRLSDNHEEGAAA